MMLGVVENHNLVGDVRLESIVRVRKRGKGCCHFFLQDDGRRNQEPFTKLIDLNLGAD